MRITIHRGTHQIGGCATEIATENTRIFIDFGAELPQPGHEPALLEVDGVTYGAQRCDGVFFTHYHGDHVGLYDRLLPGIPLYMDAAGRDILLTRQRRLVRYGRANRQVLPRLESIRPLTGGQSVTAGDLRVTPFTVDHSAYNACMFLIEGEGKRVLHTGDFRTHGFRGKGVYKVLKRYVGQVDLLIAEGTTLSRKGEEVDTESDLSRRAEGYLRNYKNVFVLCASTNIDRLAGLYAAAGRVGKPFVCDGHQARVLKTAAVYGAGESDLYAFPKPWVYGKNLLPWMEEAGFCMPVRANRAFRRIMARFDPAESIVLYSMWKGYLEQKKALKTFLEPWYWEYFHTSGHGTARQLQEVVRLARPRLGVLPIHTLAPERFDRLCAPWPVHHLQDGEVFTL